MADNNEDVPPPPTYNEVTKDTLPPVETAGKVNKEDTRISNVELHENANMAAANGSAPTNGTNGEGEGESEEKKEPMPMVGVMEVFRFSTGVEKLMMIAGMIAAIMHGCALPILMIIFGDMTDGFINDGALRNYLGGVDRKNYTIDSILNNRTRLEEVLDHNGVNGTQRTDVLKLQSTESIFATMQKFAIYYVIVACVVFILAYGQITGWLLAATRQTRRIRTAFFRSVMRKEIGWFDTHEVGELNTRLSDDMQKIQDGIGDKMGNFFQWTFTFVAGFVVGFIRGWKLTLVILAVSPALAISGGIMGKLGAALTSKELKAYAKAGAVAEEVLGAIRTVVAFGGEKKECQRYNNNILDARAFGIKKGIINGLGAGMVFLIMFASYALAFWYGSKLVREGEYSGGQLLIVFFCVLIGAFSLGNAAPNIQYFATARGAAHAIYNIIDHKSDIDSQSEEGDTIEDFQGNIEFKNINFNYPSRPEVQVLNNFNLKVNVGQTVALVGSSGCGKSTTVQLLQRFYDPLEGQVMIDGRDIRELNLRWLRQQIGVVSQEPVLFATTIEENIRYGRDGVTLEEIQQACREANAHDFVTKLPNGYQTLVGERGAQLSGGQKQRIAIARALVRNPKIILLDEATSALDTESESIVQSALDKARMGRTTIVIAHRLSTVKTADKLAGVDKGTVIEEGTHDELMKKEGVYYLLVTNQQSGIEEDDEVIGHSATQFEFKRSMSIEGPRSSHKFKRMTSKSSYQAGKTAGTGKEEEEEEVPEVAAKRVMRLNAPEWPFIALGCFAALVNGGIQPAFAIIFSEILGVYAKAPSDQESLANMYSLLFLAIGVVAGVFMFLQSFAFSKSGEELTMRLRQMTFKALLRQNISYFDDHRHTTGALTTRLATDASAVQGATGARLGTACQSLCSVGVGVVIGFVFSWKLTLVILAFTPFLLLSGFVQMKMWKGSGSDDQEALEEAGKHSTQAFENIRTVASLTKEPHFDDLYNQKMDIPYKRNLKKAHVVGLSFALSQAVVFFAYAAAFSFGAWLVENDGLSFTDMFKVFSAIVFGAMSVGNASAFAPDAGKAKLAANRLFFLFDIEPDIDSFSESGAKPNDCHGAVEFSDVYFNYPTRPDIPVLQGLDLTVKPGQRLALVGSSGCGKSTTVQLIERFYDPHQGAVHVDGTAIPQLNIQWLRSQIGIVSQEPVLFDTSISDNIAYGDNSRDVPMDEIIAAARAANIHSFIESLPQGYETSAGDKGAQLSGGQKQRIAIARALLRNPKILLLDEATSALDTESEKVVQEALDRAQEGRTSIVIAHRLSTIQNADCICVIHNGKVSEMGKHADLLAMKGIYHRLNNTQKNKR